MYYYTLSDGCYETKDEIELSHEKKWSKKEFVEMFNEAVKNGCRDSFSTSEYFIKHFGFKEIKGEFYVYCDYGGYGILSDEEITNDEQYINAEIKQKR